MRRSHVLNVAVFCQLAIAVLLRGQTPLGTRWSGATDSARAWIEAFRQDRHIPGVSVGVGVDGDVVWLEGFGFANVEHRVPVTPATRFRIGSISKSLTAAAIGRLYEQGRLDLDAEVQAYVPAFPRKRWSTTVRQIAGHVGGIRHYRGDENLSYVRYPTVLAGLAIFDDDTLIYEPGTRYAYSSYGWNLLSAVVERAAGENFLAYMQRTVFQPLGMQRTVADYVDSIIPDRTEFYSVTDSGAVINAPAVDNSYKWAGGGFLSTPEDLIRFAFAHLRSGLLKPETVELLWTSQRLRSGEPTGYGIGWFTRADPAGHRLVSHSGGSVGGTSLLLIHPAQRVVVAIVANVGGAGYRDLPLRVAELFVGGR
jgi:CubicO group peptidase (beta-lactamase class C family)